VAGGPPIQGHSSGDYTLVACMVGPGFDFADFSMVPPDSDEAASMRHHWPDLAGML
jgi:predicted cupin superfamily sugar epimerase